MSPSDPHGAASDAGLFELAEALPQIVWIAEPDGTLVYASRALYSATGLGPEDLAANGWLAAVHPDDVDRVLHAWGGSVATGTDYSVEFRVVSRPTDEYRWHLVSAQPVRDADGRVLKWYGSAVDIHDRRLAEDELQRKQHREIELRALGTRVLDQVSSGVPLPTILDELTRTVDGLIPAVRSAILLIDESGHFQLGAAPGLPPSYRLAIDGAPLLADVGTCGRAAALREPVITRDVEHDPLWSTLVPFTTEFGVRACWSTPVVAAEGSVLATVAIYFDEPRSPDPAEYDLALRIAEYVRVAIERGHQRDRLRASEERFRTVAQVVTDVIWDWTMGDDRIWWSDGLRTQFGHTLPDAGDGVAFRDANIHPDDLVRVRTGIEHALAGNASERKDEYRFRRADGTYADIIDHAIVVRDAAGAPQRMLGSMKDVTERKAMEAQLRLAHRMDAIGQLTGGLAHDFNNLLTVILGNSEVLADALAHDRKLQQLAEMSATAAARGAELTSRLLAFARKQALAPAPLDVNRIVSGMEPLLRRTLGAQVEIELVHSVGLWQAMADAAQLESALLNLCINARDAMPGGGQLRIELRNVTVAQADARPIGLEPGGYVLITVTDTGTGMDRDTLSRAFEPFFTTKEVGRGSGLGLSMVYGFAMQSRGRVELQSEPGQGTRARLYLPQAHSRESEGGPGARTRGVTGGSERILMVEDDALVRAHVQALLDSLGYSVVAAAGAREALEVLGRDYDIDLLFTDIVMPGGMSGRELAVAARELVPGLPVLLTSGYSDASSTPVAVQPPLLQKPYRRHELASRLREVLDGAKNQRRHAVRIG